MSTRSNVTGLSLKLHAGLIWPLQSLQSRRMKESAAVMLPSVALCHDCHATRRRQCIAAEMCKWTLGWANAWTERMIHQNGYKA